MPTSPHRIHHDLYRGPKILRDPGNAGIIRATADLQICEMVSGASGETRTLANPTKPGIRLTLRLLTDGGGDVVVTAPAGLNVLLETEATFGEESDMLSLISVSLTATTYRWESLVNLATVISSASPSASPSESPSASASSSPSSSPSASPSDSPSTSASTSPSTSPSTSASGSPSSSPSAT